MDAIKNLTTHFASCKTGLQVSNIGSLPEKTMFAKYNKKELIEFLPGP